MANPISPIPAVSGQPVAVSKIESYLRESWEASETSCRASLYNLVLYTQQEDSLESNTVILSQIAREHACRALLVCAPPHQARREARAWVTAHCAYDRESRSSICSEQITFVVRGFNPSDIASIVFPHLLSDLPLVFWWQGDLNEHFTSPLSRHIDRFLFDSSGWANPRRCVLQLLDRHHRRHKPFILHDFTWARTFAFRLALAACFEEPEARTQLDEIQRVQVVHGPDGAAMAQLFLAWIASRTGWICSGWKGQTLRLRSAPGSQIECDLVARPEPGALLEVTLESPHGEFRLARGDRFVERTSRLWGQASRSLFPLQPDDSAALVSQILGRGGNNAVYLAVLRFLRDHPCPRS
ncbi:MAG TPA: glucose-6-phosphate dehydrogenase assembly protein OpcA [Verrucomicrobiales bacterium]|nr:glucose-6-phosphate dehydrogenase assembly protein OpcA [Verrucomicrobiales bacterium]